MPTPHPIANVETPRLLLRAPTSADLDAVFRIFSDPATCVHNPAGPVTNKEAAGELLWRWQMHWAQHGFGLWVVCRRDAPDEVLGFGGLSWRQYGADTRLNLGFRFAPAAWGQGYATELGKAALGVTFSTLGGTEIHALVQLENAAAWRVLQKLGLQEVGTFRDFPWAQDGLVFRISSNDLACRHEPDMTATSSSLAAPMRAERISVPRRAKGPIGRSAAQIVT